MAVIATGELKSACCQPDAVSLAKVRVARRVPLADQRLPMCVPVFAEYL